MTIMLPLSARRMSLKRYRESPILDHPKISKKRCKFSKGKLISQANESINMLNLQCINN